MELASLQQANLGPWCFIGDFNAILGAHEKRGGRLPPIASCEEFRAWSDSCNLTHISTRGAAFTWFNMRGFNDHIELRLDRTICNDDWLAVWDSVACCTLPRIRSDHFPILLVLKKEFISHPSNSTICGLIMKTAGDRFLKFGEGPFGAALCIF